MKELFLTAAVPGEQVYDALKIIQGLCAMVPEHKYERVLAFAGPNAAPLRPIPSQRFLNRIPQARQQWEELKKPLATTSYYIRAKYAVRQDDFGKGQIDEASFDDKDVQLSELEKENVVGTLDFADFPDPPHPQRPVNSRTVVRITDEPSLPQLFGAMNYTFIAEQLHEEWAAYRDHTTISLSRELQRPGPRGSRWNGLPIGLPTLASYTPYDAENKWILKISLLITDDKEGPMMTRAVDELKEIREDFGGVYDFKVLDRNVLDTRVQAFLQRARAR